MRKNTRLFEGQMLSIPVTGNLFFPALVARKNEELFLLYIFDPEQTVDAICKIDKMDKQKILMVALCSASILSENKWPVIEPDLTFERETWPVPVIAAADEQENKFYALRYDDELKMEFRLRISGEVAARMLGSGIYSADSLEKKLRQFRSNYFPTSVAAYPASHQVA
jgi:hypothetical protein